MISMSESALSNFQTAPDSTKWPSHAAKGPLTTLREPSYATDGPRTKRKVSHAAERYLPRQSSLITPLNGSKLPKELIGQSPSPATAWPPHQGSHFV